MNFQQLRIIRETVRRRFNLTEVANALNTSQSGVSKHIKDLEDELGVTLFVRRGKRFLGLTPLGSEVAEIASRILLDVGNIKTVADQFAGRDEGQLSVATTHTQARYALPRVVAAFKQAFPKVHLVLHQGSPDEIIRMLLNEEADIGIATEGVADQPDLVTFPFYRWHHAVIVPTGHPLESVRPLTLQAVGRFPIVTYQQGLTGRAKIDEAFDSAGITPEIVMSAVDSDIVKTYVQLGLGIGIVPIFAYHPLTDAGLTLLEDPILFGDCFARIAVRRGHYLRSFGYRFVAMCNPALELSAIEAELQASLSSYDI